MGGDFAPENNIAGVKLALESGYAVDRYLLVGQTDLLVASLKACGLSPDHEKLEIVHSDSVVDMCESPTIALRKKKDSSIAVAARLVKDGLADGVVSAGNTGAAVASMVVHTRMAAGIERPAIASVFPGPEGFFTVLDIGANVECKPIDSDLVKPVLGFTSHISAYERCPRQFQYQKQYGFESVRGDQFWMGNVVHNTLQDIHDHVLKNKKGHLNA